MKYFYKNFNLRINLVFFYKVKLELAVVTRGPRVFDVKRDRGWPKLFLQ